MQSLHAQCQPLQLPVCPCVTVLYAYVSVHASARIIGGVNVIVALHHFIVAVMYYVYLYVIFVRWLIGFEPASYGFGSSHMHNYIHSAIVVNLCLMSYNIITNPLYQVTSCCTHSHTHTHTHTHHLFAPYLCIRSPLACVQVMCVWDHIYNEVTDGMC